MWVAVDIEREVLSSLHATDLILRPAVQEEDGEKKEKKDKKKKKKKKKKKDSSSSSSSDSDRMYVDCKVHLHVLPCQLPWIGNFEQVSASSVRAKLPIQNSGVNYSYLCVHVCVSDQGCRMTHGDTRNSLECLRDSKHACRTRAQTHQVFLSVMHGSETDRTRFLRVQFEFQIPSSVGFSPRSPKSGLRIE